MAKLQLPSMAGGYQLLDILQLVFFTNLATSHPHLPFLNPLIQILLPLCPATLPTQQPVQMVVRMSMAASSVPCTARVLSPSSSSTSSTASSSSPPPTLKFSARARPAVIRSSKAEGPLRRPMAPAAPPLQPPPSTSPPKPSPPPPPVVAPAEAGRGGVVTLEFQRKMAKEMQEYFRLKKIDEADQGPFFGFLGKNEIANGRWAMFGFAVGLLTEYATGSSFVDQLKILLSNFGIVD